MQDELDLQAVGAWVEELESDKDPTRAAMLRTMLSEIARLRAEVDRLEGQLLSHKWDSLRM